MILEFVRVTISMTIKIERLYNILIDEKSYENISVYNIHTKPLRIRFDETDGFIRVYDGTRYLVLFGNEKYDFISTELDIL